MRWDRHRHYSGVQLRCSGRQSRTNPLVTGAQPRPPPPVDAHLQRLFVVRFAPAAPRSVETTAVRPRSSRVARFQQPQKEVPQIVDQQPQSLRIVFHRCPLLSAILGLHRRVAITNELGWQGVPELLRHAGRPSRALGLEHAGPKRRKALSPTTPRSSNSSSSVGLRASAARGQNGARA